MSSPVCHEERSRLFVVDIRRREPKEDGARVERVALTHLEQDQEWFYGSRVGEGGVLNDLP